MISTLCGGVILEGEKMENQRAYPESDKLQYDWGYLNGECRQLQKKTERLTTELSSIRAENAELHYALGQKNTEKM